MVRTFTAAALLASLPIAAAAAPATLDIRTIDCATGAAAGGTAVRLASGRSDRTIRTDARGRFSSVGLEPGTYRIGLAGDAFSFARATVVDDNTAVHVVLGAAAPHGAPCSSITVDEPANLRYIVR